MSQMLSLVNPLSFYLKQRQKCESQVTLKKNEKLKPILDELGQHINDRLFSADLDKTKSHIRDFTSVCEMYPRGIAAKCSVIIQYNPIGETAISYIVGLDNNKMPVSIMENRAEITRGD